MQRAILFLAAAAAFAQVRNEDIVKGAGEDWLTYAGTYSGWRYSPLKQITAANAKNLVPGQPEQSLIWVRMTRPPDDTSGRHGRMPSVASYVVDQPAVDLIGQWITSIKSCP